MLGSSFVSDPPEPKATARQDAELTRFEDRERNVAVSYPSLWQRIPSSDPEVLLLAASAEASLLMRMTSLGTPVGQKDIPRVKRLTDKLVMSNKGVKNLRPPRRIVELGGLPGWLYIYSFQDAQSGRRGAHAHYFLFRGQELITLVFQTVPSERFATFAPLFDRLAETFSAEVSDGE